MKKVFTLIAGMLLVSSGAFAQTRFTNVITNGDFEGEELDNFVITQQGSDEQMKPEIVADEKKEGNHCAKVVKRSRAEAEELGVEWQRYDTQFFVVVPEDISLSGKMMRVSMKVRADKEAHCGTQCHNAPGGYLAYNTFGEFDFTTEWANWTWEGDSPNSDMHSIAFDLGAFEDANVYYFDDVKIEIRDPKQGSGGFTGWFSLIKNGNLETDQNFLFTYGQESNPSYTFTGRNGIDGVDRPAQRIIDTDGKPALVVNTIGFNAVHKEYKFDEEGNPILDDEGNQTYDETPIYIKENGDTLKTQSGGLGMDNWQSQFFVASNHVFKTGQKIRFKMSARADHPCTIESQIHRKHPGDYLHYQMFGNLELTEEWQTFEFEPADGITSEQSGGSTIAFNCNVYKDTDNRIYFRDFEFCMDGPDVTDKDLILGQEDIYLPVPDGSDPDAIATASIDMTKGMEILETEDFDGLISAANMRMTANEEDDFIDSPIAATDGAYFNANGFYQENEEGYLFDVNADESADKIAKFEVFNFTGEPLGDKTIPTKFVFQVNPWYYLYNVTFVDASKYDEVMGISTLNAEKKNGAIYDLMGRKVTKPAKGLYIMNGKKYFQK